MKKLLLSVVAVVAVTISTNAQIIVRGVSPAPIVGNKAFTWADNWGQTPNFNIPGTFVQDTVVFVEDGSMGTNPQGNPVSQEGCNPLTNGSAVAGKIAMIYRNTCEFGTKAFNAQQAGAVGVIIVNRLPEVVGMGVGAQGANVTIPVVMITDFDGAAIKAQMLAGPVVMFLGNKQGILPNDLTMNNTTMLRAKSGAVVSQLAQNGTEFNFEVGGRVFNFGSANATGVALKATVTNPSNTVVYDNTVTIPSILAGDSVDVDPTSTFLLPPFSLASYPPGKYTLTYTLTSDSVDMDLADNAYTTKFLVTDSLFTYATVNDVTKLPENPSGFRPNPSGATFGSCIFIKDANASRVGIEGAYFSYSSSATDSINLQGEEITTTLYRWDDPFTDLSVAATFNNLVQVSAVQYYYPGDLQDSIVYAAFPNPVLLTDNDKYLLRVQTVKPLLFGGHDANSNYEHNINFYLQPISPTEVGGTYNAVGFGGDAINSVGGKVFNANELSLEETSTLFANVYPNPTTDKLFITLNVDEDASVEITDLSGKVVAIEKLDLTNGAGSFNVSKLAEGAYILNITTTSGYTKKASFIKK